MHKTIRIINGDMKKHAQDVEYEVSEVAVSSSSRGVVTRDKSRTDKKRRRVSVTFLARFRAGYVPLRAISLL